MVKVLLVEDNPDEVLLFQRAFRRVGLEGKAQLDTVEDGEAALAYLGVSDPRPKVVFLDLKLPRKSGLEVLEWVRAQQELQNLPVVMLTSSREQQDLERAYKLHVNAYLVKPSSAEQLDELTSTTGRFWLWLNQTPD